MSDKYLRDEKQQLLNAIGTEACWGWSPAIDFTEVLQNRLTCQKKAKQSCTCAPQHENVSVADRKQCNHNTISNSQATRNITRSKENDELHNLQSTQQNQSKQPVNVDELLQEMIGTVKLYPSKNASTRVANIQRTSVQYSQKLKQQKQQEQQKRSDHDVHILMAGACDVRHILRTLSSLKLQQRTQQKQLRTNSSQLEPNISTTPQQQQRQQCRTTVDKLDNNMANMSTLQSQSSPPKQTAQQEQSKCKQQKNQNQSDKSSSSENANTIDKHATNASQPLTYHFYIYEPNLRLHCRHLFFLQWLLDSMFALEELQERVLMFLDVYGNACTRETTAAQARSVIQRLLKVLNTDTGALCQFITMHEMKLKQRDFVQEQLLHWVRDSSQADLSSQWARRVRQEMAQRYDNRDNLIDWDFVFKLSDYTNLIKFPEYRTWRNTGVAFDVTHINPRRGFEYNYNVPNKSLCLFDRKGHGVYYGEVKNGPFYSFGAATQNKHICHRSADGTCKYGNGVISMHNVRSWLYTLMTGKPWPWADHHFAWDDEKYYNYLPDGTPRTTTYQAHFPHVKFHFVGLNLDRFLLHRRHRQCALFDAAFFGTSCTQLMTRNFFDNAMARQGCVIAQTAKFVIDAADEAKEMYTQKIKQFALAANWEVNEKVTHQLHKNQPAPRTVQGTQTPAQQTAERRFKMPYQIALTYKLHQQQHQHVMN